MCNVGVPLILAVTESCRGLIVGEWRAAASAEHANRVPAHVNVAAPEPLLQTRARLGLMARAAQPALLAWRRGAYARAALAGWAYLAKLKFATRE